MSKFVLRAAALALIAWPATTSAQCTPTVFINELHYDNDGTDVNEFIEVAGPAGTDLTGWTIVLYNGNDGASYGTPAALGTIDDEGTGFGAISVSYPSNGIQNGSPDGVALVDNTGSVVQFLSYEGAMTATNGPASGMTSTDIGVSEISTTTVGNSLQLTGTGTCYSDFMWTSGAASAGSLNAGQSFGSTPVDNVPSAAPSSTPVAVLTIQQIQGVAVDETSPSPYDGDTVQIAEAYVTRVAYNGFFVQESSVGDPGVAASSGIFVFTGGAPSDLIEGDAVTIQGTVTEYQTWTELTSVTYEKTGGVAVLFTPVSLALPVANKATLENLESMLVSVVPAAGKTLVTSEYFNLDRFGEVVICGADSTLGRLYQFTQLHAPDETAYAAYVEELERTCLVMDDNSGVQNPVPIEVGGLEAYALPGYVLRGGNTVTKLVGPLIANTFGPEYRIQPLADGDLVINQSTNPRMALPAFRPGSNDIKVATANVLNFFTTLGKRGADTSTEYSRQYNKMLTGLAGLNADVYTILEIENSGGQLNGDVASRTAVNGLSSRLSGRNYKSVALESRIVQVGYDEIKVDIFYDANRLTLVNASTTDDRYVNPALVAAAGGAIFGTPTVQGKSRAPLLATFVDNKFKYEVTVVANHFKSKGSACPGDPSSGALSTGNCNNVRVQTAQAVLDFIRSSPVTTNSTSVMIMGDLNAYAMEDPIQVLQNAGFKSATDLEKPEYSYLFDAQFGTLDYIFIKSGAFNQLGCAATWHVNSDEADVIDYNLDFGRPANLFDASIPNRYSDHDPLLITFSLVPRKSPNVCKTK